MTHWSIVCALVVHDLLLRAFWRFYYLRVHRFSNKDEYLDSISRSYKRYLLKQRKRFEDLLAQRAVHVVAVDKCTPRLEKFVLEQSSLRGNTAFKNIIYRLSLRSILTSRHSDAYIVVDRNTDQIICFEANYRSGHVYYWLDTFIDAGHSLSKSGMYFYFFLRKLDACFEHGIAYLRMGPTTDETKMKMGGERIRFLLR